MLQISMRIGVFVSVALTSMSSPAQLRYQAPEKQITDLISSPGFSHPYFNHQKTAYVKYRNQITPSLEFMSRPDLRLAGLRLNAQNLSQVSSTYKEDLRYFDYKTKKDKEIKFAKSSYIQTLSWSPDGKFLAVILEAPKCVELWLVDIPSLKKRKVPDLCLNAVFDRAGELSWVESRQILVNKRVSLKPVEISRSAPLGPVIKESKGVIAQNRTYQDLLKTPQDADAFAQAALGQIVLINVKTLTQKKLATSGVYSSVSLSPNREWAILTQLQAPFPYTVPYNLFKRDRLLVSLNGKIKKGLGSVGPFENLPIEGVSTGPRNIEWDPTQPQRFIHVEALDQGDWKVKVPFREKVVMNTIESAQGKIRSEVIGQLENRYGGIDWLEDAAKGFFIYDYERDSKTIRYLHAQSKASNEYQFTEFLKRNSDDDYSDPGRVQTGRNQFNLAVAVIQKSSDGDWIYWTGEGATPEGNRPFLKKMNLLDKKFSEVFRSPLGRMDRFGDFMDRDFQNIILRTQSPTEPPRYEVRSLLSPQVVGTPLFEEENPFKIMAQLKKKIIKYKRNDGIELSGTLYYPINYEEGKKYPAVVSAYPLEYTDAKSAGQTRATVGNYEIPLRATPIYFALRGYVVLDEAQIPIVGHPETKNDTFVQQLTADAETTVRALEQTGMVDVQRIGVIGHSYGAFMVSHLLTHTKFFAAGIARSGAYNRTLTPFGFQGERRPLWETKEVYLKMSSFLDADKMKFPLLMIHGMEDNNPGTFTLQSERYFDALKGQGAVVRLVLLPNELHAYAAQESVQHVLWESFAWFDKYLKN